MSCINDRLRLPGKPASEFQNKNARDQNAQIYNQFEPFQSTQSAINCRCKCHKSEKTSWRLAYLRYIVGSAVITYRGQPGRPCTRASCLGHQKGCSYRGMHLVYHLPAWLARAALTASLTSTGAAAGPHIAFGLRVRNRIGAEESHRSKICSAILDGDIEATRRLLEARCPSFYDLIGEHDAPPLTFAIYKKEPAMVKMLLQAGADPFQETQDSANIDRSPLGMVFRYSVTAGHKEEEIVRLFDLEDYIEEAEFKPLQLAIMGKLQIDLAKALRKPQYLADIDYRALNGFTALDIAVMRNDMEAVKLVISAGADVNAKDEKTPLDRACMSNKFEIAELLLEAGASVTNRDYEGWTALGSVCATPCSGKDETLGQVRLAAMLLRYGADCSARINSGLVSLNLAIAMGKRELSEFLLSRGADINTVDYYGLTPLLWTVMEKNYDGLQIVLEHDADLLVRDKSGEGVLHRIARFSQTSEIHLFTRTRTKNKLRALDMAERNQEGKTPLDLLAERNPDKELLEAFAELAECVEQLDGWASDLDEAGQSDDEFVDALES
jgi:ankyrin repeat protein